MISWEISFYFWCQIRKSHLDNIMFVLFSSVLFICLSSGTSEHPNRLYYLESWWIGRFVLKCLLTPPNTVVLEVAFACKWLAFKADLVEMFTETMKISFGVEGKWGREVIHGWVGRGQKAKSRTSIFLFWNKKKTNGILPWKQHPVGKKWWPKY